jgi:hypothetical protein
MDVQKGRLKSTNWLLLMGHFLCTSSNKFEQQFSCKIGLEQGVFTDVHDGRNALFESTETFFFS